MSTKKAPIRPVDIKLPEGALLDNGTLFVILRTLDQLEAFWHEHKEQFEFACEGNDRDNQLYLRGYEWVFGTSKSAVVKTVMRWDKMGVGCEFYDFSNDPWLKGWFDDRDAYRASQIESGNWSNADEAEYVMDCVRRTPQSYHGYWRFCNLPGGWEPSGWFNPCGRQEELFDPTMPIAEVELTLQEQTFDDWKESDLEEIQYHDRASIEEMIVYWRGEQTAGQGYYGDENEAGTEVNNK